jgi:hypothetical protein
LSHSLYVISPSHVYHQWRCNYFLPVPVPVSTSDTYTSLSNLPLFYCLYLLSLTELIDFKNTSCIAKWLYAATWPWWILFFYLDFFSIFISPQIYIFSKKNILIPNVAEKNILILVEEKKIFWFWVLLYNLMLNSGGKNILTPPPLQVKRSVPKKYDRFICLFILFKNFPYI